MAKTQSNRANTQSIRANTCASKIVLALYVFFIIAVIVFAVVSYNFHNVWKEFSAFLENTHLNIFFILIGIKVFSFIIFLLQTCRCDFTIYAILFSLVVILEISIGVAVYFYRNKLADEIQYGLNITIERHGTFDLEAWNFMQSNFRCCGVLGPDDWMRNNLSIPESCHVTDKIHPKINDTLIYLEGCFDKLYNITDNKMLLILVAAIVMFLFQSLMTMSCCCCQHVP